MNQKINTSIKYQYEQISDNIREWEMIDSAGYSVPNGGIEVGIYNFIKGNASLNSNRLMAHLQISNDFSLNTIYDPITNSVLDKDESIAKKMLRHVSVGAELNPFRKNFFLRAGFNFQRREDLNLTSSVTFSGFSFGTGFRIRDIEIDYSRSSYHAKYMINTFSIVTNLSTFGL